MISGEIVQTRAGARTGWPAPPTLATGYRVLVEADDVAVFVDVDADGGGLAGQAWHGAHVAADQVDEAGADTCLGLPDGEAEAGGGTLQVGVVTQAVLGLGDADREVAEAVLLVAVELL